MSLQTDRVFYEALKSDPTITRLTGGRIYNTAIPLPDTELLNVHCPYIIVTFDGLTNQRQSKDEVYEGDVDVVKIGIEVTAVTREALATLTERVRKVVREFFEIYETEASSVDEGLLDLIPLDYDFTAGSVVYDPDKPCYVLQLIYQCTTNI